MQLPPDFVRRLCAAGHLSTLDADAKPSAACDVCGDAWVWSEAVTFGGEGDATATPLVKFADAQLSTCDHCGLSRFTAPPRYKIPKGDKARVPLRDLAGKLHG